MTDWTGENDPMFEEDLADAGLARGACGLWLDGGENVGVLWHEGHVVVGWIALEWRSPAPPPDFVLQEPVHLAPPVESKRFTAAVDAARAAGIARREKCRFCGETFNPGRMDEADVCHGCSEQHLGTVH